MPPAVVSGPYLQAVGPTSALVVWRTSTPDEGRVTASTQRHSGLLTFHQASPPDAASLDVIVALTGLHPHTTYAYRMWGTAGELLPGQEFQFTTLWGPSDSQTAPVPDTAAQPPPSPSALASLPVRLLLLGDVGTGTGSTIVPAVLSAAASFAAKTLTAPSALVLLGDQGYEHGADSAYTLNLFQPLQSLLATTPMFPVPGNRDGLRSAILRHGQETGPYFTRFFAPREGESGGLASHSGVYYAVDVGALHLIVLDSVFSDRSAGGAMANWLRADLAALNGTQWLVAVWHHPPYSKGGTDSDFDRTAIEMRETFLPLLEAAGVDVIVSGHAHNYERSVLIDGAYGSSDEFGDGNVVDAGLGAPPDVPYVKPPGLVAHKGCVAVVAGSAGDINYKNYGMMHPTHLRLAGGAGRPALLKMHGLLEAGSFFIDVDPENSTLTGTFVTANGDVGDRFAIVKRAGAQEATRAQLASVSASSRGQLQRAQSLVPVATGAWSESLWLVILLAIAVQFVWSLFLAKRRKGAKVEPPVDEPV
ncbi:MAG: metallophosphoesterase [Rudaea sp.]|nr:metallophosphoesterase [Rudaea sp.]